MCILVVFIDKYTYHGPIGFLITRRLVLPKRFDKQGMPTLTEVLFPVSLKLPSSVQ